MRFDRLDLNLLVALDALLEERSVSAAAQRLHLSQPAVTGSLNRLRDYFGDQLLVLSGRRMLPTPKAEELAGPVRRALLQIRAEITRPGDFDPLTASRRFHLVLSDYAYTILFAHVMAAAAQQAPGISFDVSPPDSRSVERLERAETDLFVTVANFCIGKHPQLPLFRDDEVVICWPGAGHGKLDADAFFGAGHAIATFGSERRSTLADGAIEAMERERRVEMIVPSFGALPQAVVGTRRLATMHRLYAEHFATHYPIEIRPAPFALPQIVEIAQWHQLRERDPGLKWLITLVKEQCARRLGASSLVRLEGTGAEQDPAAITPHA